jgi:hypothetical protein
MRMTASRTTPSKSRMAWLVRASWIALAACGGTQVAPDDSLDVTSNSTDMGLVEPAKPVTPRQRGTSREPTLREARVIQELMRNAEQVRHLRFKGPVPVLVQDRERITAYVETQIEDDELARAHTVYTALGLLDARADVRGMLLRLMGEQIVGYYDAEAKHLSVRDDVMRAFARNTAQEDAPGFEEDDGQDELIEARIVLVHELVHALQDQNLGLSARIEEKRDTDAENAFHALVEGDATLAMIGHALEREGIPLHRVTGNPAQVRSFPELVRQSPLAGSELEQAPAIVRVPLLSAYVDGLSFCASLHGAADWAGVDRAYGDPCRCLHSPTSPSKATSSSERTRSASSRRASTSVKPDRKIARRVLPKAGMAIACACTRRRTKPVRWSGSACGIASRMPKRPRLPPRPSSKPATPTSSSAPRSCAETRPC